MRSNHWTPGTVWTSLENPTNISFFKKKPDRKIQTGLCHIYHIKPLGGIYSFGNFKKLEKKNIFE